MARLSSVALVSALGLVAAGALSAATVTAAQAESTAPTIRVFISKHHVVRMTDHLRPGVHRFAVRSGGGSSFQLLMPHGHYTKRMLAHDVNTGLAGEDSSSPAAVRAIERFERHVTLYGGVPSDAHHRGVMWADLDRGTYWVADTDPAKLLPRKVLTVHVGGRPVSGHLPSGPTLRAVHEADWAGQPGSIPGEGVLRFANHSRDNHFVAMAKLAEGKTMSDVRAWFADPNSGPPPFDMSAPGLDTGVVSPGQRMALRYSLPAGDYAMMCWWPDAENGGMPHAFMGMVRGITVR